MTTTSTISAASVAQVDASQMNTFRSYVTMLGDPTAKDEIKMKAAQELSENFELITQCSGFQLFLEHSMKIFIKILHDGDPLFISEYNLQQVSQAKYVPNMLKMNLVINSRHFDLSMMDFNCFSIGSKINLRNDTSIANIGNSPSICRQHFVSHAKTIANR